MKFPGWAPDAPDFIDIADAVYLEEVYNLVPTSSGYRVMESASTIVSNALAAQCIGAASVMKLNGTRRVLASTTDTIYELSSGSWSDITTPTLTATSTSRVIFAQFGDATIATNDADQLQVSTTGNFAAISGSPKAKIVFSVPNFVIVLNTQDGSGSTAFGDSPDRWWCSGFQDHTVWTPARSTLCQSGRLIGKGGELTAGAAFGTGFVAYKEREMWLAVFDGDTASPNTFRFEVVPGDVGCVGPEAVVDIGGAHIFVGSDNIWLFDGTRPRSIADNLVRDWFFSAVPSNQLKYTRLVFDRARMLIWFFFNTNGTYAGVTTEAICFHLQTGMWGRGRTPNIEASFNYTEPGITWANVATTYPTWASMSVASWDSTLFVGEGRTLAYFGTDHKVYGFSGARSSGSFTTKAFGLPASDSNLERVVLRGFVPERTVTGAELSVSAAAFDTAGTNLLNGGDFSRSGASFRGRSTGRFHQLSGTIVSDQVLWGADVKLSPTGDR